MFAGAWRCVIRMAGLEGIADCRVGGQSDGLLGGCDAQQTLDGEIELRSALCLARLCRALTGREQRPNFVSGMMTIIHSAKRFNQRGYPYFGCIRSRVI